MMFKTAARTVPVRGTETHSAVIVPKFIIFLARKQFYYAEKQVQAGKYNNNLQFELS